MHQKDFSRPDPRTSAKTFLSLTRIIRNALGGFQADSNSRASLTSPLEFMSIS